MNLRMLITQFNTAILLMACLTCSLTSHAATWVKLKDNAHSKLLLDKQSIVTQATLKKVWVKVEYKTPQKNPDSVDKVYNLSKALWHFDCTQQTSATTQVFQYLNQELVYSASVDMKGAEFIEPLPESDLEVAMHYICKSNSVASTPKSTVQSATATKPAAPIPTAEAALTSQEEKQDNIAKPAPATNNNTPETTAPKPVVPTTAAPTKVNKTTSANDWDYQGKKGPDQWGTLNKQYASCTSGVNQSPVQFENTIHAALKPIRSIHKFAAKDVQSMPHGLRVHFKQGNMMVLDKSAFQLKYLDFRAPSEHQLNGQPYPLELQLYHEDSKQHVAIMSILFKAGELNAELNELLAQLPQKAGEIIPLKTRLTPNKLMPTNPQYYRYSGSLTTPPCHEGVRWIVMKSALQASTEQIIRLSTAMGGPNNRPIQALNGRSVLE